MRFQRHWATEDLAAKNSGPTPTTTPPATDTPSQPATTYTPTPPIQQATSPARTLTTNYQANATVVTTTNTTTTTVTDTSEVVVQQYMFHNHLPRQLVTILLHKLMLHQRKQRHIV